MSSEHTEQPILPEGPHFKPERSEEYPQLSEIVEEIMMRSDPALSIISYFQELNIKEIPILSTTPPEIIEQFRASGFDIKIIPVSQKDHAVFHDDGVAHSESEVPAWFREAKEKIQEQKKQTSVDIWKSIKDRWFLISILLLGMASVAGFGLGWAYELPKLFGRIDLYLSIYGSIAISRSIWQISRAERYNKKARSQVRPHYLSALISLDEDEFPDGSLETLEGDKLAEKARKAKIVNEFAHVTTKNITWDEFLVKTGLMESPNPGKKKKPSLLEKYQSAGNQEFNRDELIDKLSGKIIDKEFAEKPPSVAIVIPTYQTSIEEMSRLLRSIKKQSYPVTNAYVVYNDDPNDPLRKETKQPEFLEFQRIVDQINSEPGRNTCTIQLFAQQARGKREAMAMGFATALGKSYINDLLAKYPDVPREQLSAAIGNLNIEELPDFRHDYVLNIDSDTEIHDPLSVLNSLLIMKANPKAATTTGDVRVSNRTTNTLAEMTYQRYNRAFFVERAAQSLDGNVTCMSGPWVMMRSEALAEVFDEWYFQEYLGKRCTYGDDRHLSTLFLKHHWKSLFTPDSAVLTDCPTDWKTFLRQQLRWNQSFNRENLILLEFLHELDYFTQMDVVYQQSFAFVMTAILAQIAFKAGVTGAKEGPLEAVQVVTPYSVAVLLYNELFFGLYGAIKNKDPHFFMSPIYLYYYARGLYWTKLKALRNRRATGWGTKGETPPSSTLETPTVEELISLGESPSQLDVPIEESQKPSSEQNGESL